MHQRGIHICFSFYFAISPSFTCENAATAKWCVYFQVSVCRFLAVPWTCQRSLWWTWSENVCLIITESPLSPFKHAQELWKVHKPKRTRNRTASRRSTGGDNPSTYRSLHCKEKFSKGILNILECRVAGETLCWSVKELAAKEPHQEVTGAVLTFHA